MSLGWYKLLMSRAVTTYWPATIAVWMVVAVLLKTIAPPWSEIAADGDLAFLPSNVPSAIGQHELEKAFPGSKNRSQMVIVFANRETELSPGDLALAMDVTRHLHLMAAQSAWNAWHSREADTISLASQKSELSPNAAETIDAIADEESAEQIRDSALADIVSDNLDQVIEIETELSTFLESEEPSFSFVRFASAYEMRGKLLESRGEKEQAAIDLASAQLIREQEDYSEPSLPDWAEVVSDTWSWRSDIVGHKLGSDNPNARLVALQLTTDFTAVGNIEVLEGVEGLIKDVRMLHNGNYTSGLRSEVSGSAAVGADMLRAAASGVRLTEIVTIILVLVILSVVYRAPFLVAIPLTSIAVSLVVATSVVALLARDPSDPTSSGLGVFTTTRIFIVVLLFGVGTDFCLFFLARNRELLQVKEVHSRKQMYRVIASGWLSVHDALVASALTTIVGLALMWFSYFEKFQFSGPIIAISLCVTLLVCLTFTPALLSGLGRTAFWPLLLDPQQDAVASSSKGSIQTSENRASRYWGRLAKVVVSQPTAALTITLTLLAGPAIYGFFYMGQVTYDLTEELSESATSRRGANIIRSFFPTTDASPITVLVTRNQPFDDDEALRDACSELSTKLYVPGVDSVRSLTDPLGDYPPGKRMSLFAQDAWRRRLLLGHRITKDRYVSSVDSLTRRVAKFDVVLSQNPFSLDAAATLQAINAVVAKEIARAGSPWQASNTTVSGTTVGVSDLRAVTQSDQRRIQLLVTLGVWLVLVVLLRQLVLSTYLIFTVLLSYFTTIGVTYWTFSYLYREAYGGLDWKVPLFLFVILVAVGQDYNVYLVTRIFEERRRASLQESVRRALQMTGGIITSCGFVMAGTFVAMTSPAVLQWLSPFLPTGWISTEAPVLRGITELGFALSFGVLLDTLVVRSILVPSFMLLWDRPAAAAKSSD